MLRASDAVIDMRADGRVLRVTGAGNVGAQAYGGFGALSAADRLKVSLQMQGVTHAIQNGFYAAQGRVAVLSATSRFPVAVAYDIMRNWLSAALPSSVASVLPVGAAPTEVIKNVSNALRTLESGFKARVVPAIEDVKAGRLAPEKWFAMATPYISGIASILDELGDSSMGALVSKTADDFVEQAKKIGLELPKVGSKLADALPYILGAAVLLFVYQLTAPIRAASSLLARPRLQGYNRRTTRSRRRSR